jgi:hypothetical protein
MKTSLKVWAGMTQASKSLIALTLLGAFLATTFRSSHANSYSVSGTVSGYAVRSGSPLSVYDNGTKVLSINTNGVFTFTSTASTYNITVTPPTGETCSVANASGALSNNVTNIWISCQPVNSTPPPSRWTKLTNKAPGQTGTMLLLWDGSVMVVNGVAAQGTQWFRLSPDSGGHYVDGTWTATTQYPTIANSNCPHELFASQVLTDGRVFVAGGEYPNPPSGLPGCAGPGQSNTGVDTELYDPVSNTWSSAKPPSSLIDPTQPPKYPALCPQQAFIDVISETLPDGSVLMAPVCPMNCGDTLIFNPKSFSPSSPGSGWSFGGKLANTGGTALSCSQQEASWVKLQDASILTVDPPAQPGASETSERYVPALQKWVQDTAPGFPLFDSEFGYNGDGEEGPAFLTPTGNAIFIGGSIYTGIYTPAAPPPSGAPPAPGMWVGNVLSPNGPATAGAALSADDAPGAMMVDGKILLALNFAATQENLIPSPIFFYEYNPTQNTFTEVAGPGNPGAPSPWTDCGPTTMLDLPDGTILMPSGCDTTQLYVYQPSGPPLQQGQPKIASVTKNTDGSWHLTGTGLNGISEGAAYGDDAQMASNYPLVRLTTPNGTVRYARTYNWSSTGVDPGTAGSTEFALPSGIAVGTYSLQVVANGNASVAVPFTIACPIGNVWDTLASLCVPAPTCPANCKYGCIYTPPQEGQPPVLICRGPPPP